MESAMKRIAWMVCAGLLAAAPTAEHLKMAKQIASSLGSSAGSSKSK
jgi:hypothetical protein